MFQMSNAVAELLNQKQCILSPVNIVGFIKEELSVMKGMDGI